MEEKYLLDVSGQRSKQAECSETIEQQHRLKQPLRTTEVCREDSFNAFDTLNMKALPVVTATLDVTTCISSSTLSRAFKFNLRKSLQPRQKGCRPVTQKTPPEKKSISNEICKESLLY